MLAQHRRIEFDLFGKPEAQRKARNLEFAEDLLSNRLTYPAQSDVDAPSLLELTEWALPARDYCAVLRSRLRRWASRPARPQSSRRSRCANVGRAREPSHSEDPCPTRAFPIAAQTLTHCLSVIASMMIHHLWPLKTPAGEASE